MRKAASTRTFRRLASRTRPLLVTRLRRLRVARTRALEAARHGALPAALALMAGVAACSSPQNVLAPRGPAAARVVELWWVFLAMGVAVSVAVAVLLALAIRRSRQREKGQEAGEINGHALVGIGAGVITPIVLFALLVQSYRVGADVYPPVDAAAEAEALTVEVVGHQFWWEVRYPEHGVVSANEVYIPAGRRVRFLVRSHDVIHSFWVPQLHGKIDMVPGHTNRLWVEADEPGRFRGQCAEYCGVSHALMALWVIAVEEAEFEAWLERRAEPTPEPDDPEVQRGRAIFIAASCMLCHATRGAPLPPEVEVVGPDLTHLATRSTLAAGTLPNTRDGLTRWITDPQGVKPGSGMPPTRLRPEQLGALLTYLESLR